ncbi:hypothetical_protein_-_conserved [Leishmania infantum]|nr:hypothetical_protein_-_conserved [Leishmania infantum]SUZ39750.1 hypothetical_protein_-_conserved [Leishmania infantum]
MTTQDEGAEPQWTLLVCMPECQAAHASIVRELRDAGVDVVERRFVLTPDQALTIAQQYAHLRRRAAARQFSTSTAAEAEAVKTSSQPFLSEARHRLWSETLSQQQPQQGQHPQSQQQAESRAVSGQLLDSIMRLAQGHRAHQQSGPSRVPSPGKGADGACEVAPRPSLSALLSLRGKRTGSDGASSEPTLSSEHTAHTAASAAITDTTAAGTVTPALYQRSLPGALSSSSATASPKLCTPAKDSHMFITDPQVWQQVASLLQGGTVLVLLLRAVNAVERLVRLAGPQDPLEARRVVPESWSARYGVDEARMGVYTPSNLADARVAVEAVFGGAYADETAHGKPRLSLEREAYEVARASPATEDSPATPLSFAQILPTLRAGVPAAQRISYYTGVQGPTASAATTFATIPTAAAEGIDAVAPAEQAATDADGSMMPAVAMGPDPAVCPSATPQYPQRQERLGELDDLLRGHVGCWPSTHTHARMRVRVRSSIGVQADVDERKSE